MAKHLITGGAGFIGSHLADLLINKGESVTIIDNLSTGRFANVAHLERNKRFSCIVDNVSNEHLTEGLVREADCVYHLAASVGVRLVIERPTEAIINNVMGTEIVLRNACRYRKPILIISTSEVYGKSRERVFSEDSDCVMGPTSRSRWGYATSKAIDEFLALAYFQEKQLQTVVVRLFNTVGPRQTGHYGMVIPTLVRQALLQQPLTVFGDGTQTRCFAHVWDVVPMLVDLLGRPDTAGLVFNLGTQEEVSIKRLAERIIELTGSRSTITYVPYKQAYPPGFEDMERRLPDLARLKRFTGYEPKHHLDDILRDVISYIQEKVPQQEPIAIGA
ncbi:MAG: GDP-mannose 4,6-dehydratase [Bryobacteraceae bacterium]|jgi:UDP-glucose 4-epimerase